MSKKRGRFAHSGFTSCFIRTEGEKWKDCKEGFYFSSCRPCFLFLDGVGLNLVSSCFPACLCFASFFFFHLMVIFPGLSFVPLSVQWVEKASGSLDPLSPLICVSPLTKYLLLNTLLPHSDSLLLSVEEEIFFFFLVSVIFFFSFLNSEWTPALGVNTTPAINNP